MPQLSVLRLVYPVSGLAPPPLQSVTPPSPRDPLLCIRWQVAAALCCFTLLLYFAALLAALLATLLAALLAALLASCPP
jgi:hypothetical protein